MAKSPWKKLLVGTGALLGGSVLLCLGIFGPCWRSWLLDGMVVSQCPAGEVKPVLTVNGWNLGRERGASLSIAAAGHYVVGKSTSPLIAPIRRFTPKVTVIGSDGVEHPVEVTKKGWIADSYYAKSAHLKIPKLPDGDYKLHVVADTAAGPAELDVALPLFAPAQVHVLTDSPLYKPGQTIQFRSVAMHKGSLQPLNGRPGVWKVFDPSGELVLEEKAVAANFGIAASDFPLDDNADVGNWRVRYETGADFDEVSVEVKPFRLPRFTVDVTSAKTAFFPGDTVSLRGVARYTSGAPVANAPVTINFSAGGSWPPPLEWMETHNLTTDRSGAFALELGALPADLAEKLTLSASVQVLDPAGETIYGGASLLLSADKLAAEAVSELGEGLVPSTNNRLYVRVTDAAGKILPETPVKLKKTWDPGDPGLEAITDADGVARFQVDPGEPVTIVNPPLPKRRKKGPEELVLLGSAVDGFSGTELDVDGLKVLDRWRERVKPCSLLGVGGGAADSVQLAVLVGAGGQVREVVAGSSSRAAECVVRSLKSERAFAGKDRLWSISLDFEDPKSPYFSWSSANSVGNLDVSAQVEDALIVGRSCAASVAESGDLRNNFVLFAEKGSKRLRLEVMAGDSEATVPAAVSSCISRYLEGLELEEPAEESGAEAFTLSVEVPVEASDRPDRPTTWQGFSYEVSAFKGEEYYGKTTLNIRPGSIPDLRLRFSEVLVNPGDTVDLLALRGPNFNGYIPEKLALMQGSHQLIAFDFDPKKRTGKFKIPDDASGFATVEFSGARAVLYIRPKARLDVALSMEGTEFRPGQTANLLVQTTGAGGSGIPAGVTLSGVDSTLGTLVKLPGADEFARVTVQAQSSSPAFGMLDARALQTGQIAGDNAAQATILRISSLPPGPPGVESLSVSGAGILSLDGDYADSFYTFFEEVRAEVRKWEKEAPEGEVMTPKKMTELWERVLKAKPAEDPWGRPLHLSTLPGDFLLLTDPRMVVSDGTRLPEDIENWSNYVRREAP